MITFCMTIRPILQKSPLIPAVDKDIEIQRRSVLSPPRQEEYPYTITTTCGNTIALQRQVAMGPNQIKNEIEENIIIQNRSFNNNTISVITLQRQVAMTPDQIMKKMKKGEGSGISSERTKSPTGGTASSSSTTTVSTGGTTNYVLKYAPDYRAKAPFPLFGRQQRISSLISITSTESV